MLNNDTALELSKNFNSGWDVEHVLEKIDSSIIDASFIKAVERLFALNDVEEWIKDRCIINLVNKIRKDESRKDSISEYLSKYADTFNRWDNSPMSEKELI